MDEYNNQPVTYLGDGVYAIHDGNGIYLRLGDHKNESGQIYLEPSILKALNNFNENVPKWLEYKRSLKDA